MRHTAPSTELTVAYSVPSAERLAWQKWSAVAVEVLVIGVGVEVVEVDADESYSDSAMWAVVAAPGEIES